MGQQQLRIGKTTITDNVDNTTFNKELEAPNLVTLQRLTDSLNAIRNGSSSSPSLPDSIKYVSKKFTQNSAGLYSTVQAAVNSSAGGSLIFIFPGTYVENVVITRPVNMAFYEGAYIKPSSGVGILLSGVSSDVNIVGYGTIISPGIAINSSNLIYDNVTYNLEFKYVESTGSRGVVMVSTGRNANFNFKVHTTVKGYFDAIYSLAGSQQGTFQATTFTKLNGVLYTAGQNGSPIGFSSTNDGASWDKKTLPGNTYNILYGYNSSNDTSYIFYVCSSGAYRTTNDGVNWIAMSGFTDYYSGSLNKQFWRQAGVLYYGDQSYITKTTNNGITWTRVIQHGAVGAGGSTAQIFVDSITTWYCIKKARLHKSTDLGSSWIPIGNKFNTSQDSLFQSTISINNGSIYAGSWTNGIYKSTDYGDTWTQSGLTTQRITCLFSIGPDTLFAANPFSTTSRTTNGGTTWTTVNSDGNGSGVGMFYRDGDNFYMGTNGGIYKSTNRGMAWVASNTGTTWSYPGKVNITADSLYAYSNPPTTYGGAKFDFGNFNVNINYAIANSTVIWGTQNSTINYKGRKIECINTIGHAIKNSDNSFTGTVDKIKVNPGNTVYAAVEITGSAQVYLQVADSISAGGYAAINAASTGSYINIKAKCILNNSTLGANLTIFAYCAGIIEADEVKNIGGSGNAKLLDIGAGTGPMVFKNIHFSGYSAGPIIGIGNNNGSQFQNCIFYNPGGGYILGNYHSSAKNVRIINCWGNVGSWTTGGVNFNYLLDSIRVDTDVQ